MALMATVAASGAGATRAEIPLSSPHVFGSTSQGSVTELNASTRAFVKILKDGGCCRFDGESAITSDGTNVWVTNDSNDTITGFPAA